jgi:hypothetical protein
VKSLVKSIFCLALFFVPIQFGFSRGDKIIPQIVDGPGWATKFDLMNVSSRPPDGTTNPKGDIIGTFRLAFYHNDGTPWSIQTNKGTGSSFSLTLYARQTLRIETLSATQPLSGGYAVIYDEEPNNSDYSENYVLGISVFYVVLDGPKVVDTVTVSVAPPTALAKVPVEIDDTQGINSGLAVANWAGATNSVRIDLYDENGNKYSRSASVSLASKEQKAQYLTDQSLFPELTSFKGMAEFTAVGPVAILGLLGTRASDSTQRYSTLVPVDMESLRRNTYLAVLQAETDGNPAMPLDLDNMVSDFYRADANPDFFSWDLEYMYGTKSNPSDTTIRYLSMFNGAGIASLSGTYNNDQFDAISLSYLKSLTYTTNDIDLSGSNLYLRRTFAVRTDLGNYAKMRIFRIIDTTSSDFRPLIDLVLEVVVYR